MPLEILAPGDRPLRRGAPGDREGVVYVDGVREKRGNEKAAA